MKQINIQRLRKLESVLRLEKENKKKFTQMSGLDRWNYAIGLILSHCGTVGCAMGASVTLFPDYFRANEIDLPKMNRIYGLNHDESVHLFMPEHQRPELYGGKMLDDCSTAEEVADNISAFIERKVVAK